MGIKPARGSKKVSRISFRSKLEEKIGKQLVADGIPIDYENVKMKYTQPAKQRTYTPDFILPNNIVIEAKGHMTVKTRQKYVMIRDSHPEIDLRFVFGRASNKIYKGSKTTYGDWCDKEGFIWAEKRIPKEWYDEDEKPLPFDGETIIRRG